MKKYCTRRLGVVTSGIDIPGWVQRIQLLGKNWMQIYLLATQSTGADCTHQEALRYRLPGASHEPGQPAEL